MLLRLRMALAGCIKRHIILYFKFKLSCQKELFVPRGDVTFRGVGSSVPGFRV